MKHGAVTRCFKGTVLEFVCREPITVTTPIRIDVVRTGGEYC
jgi:hypothetical protein